MQIVIDVSEKVYEFIKEFDFIRNGKLIPEGHGRLIDADILKKTIDDSIEASINWMNNTNGTEIHACARQAYITFIECALRLKQQPTIIEADGGKT